MIQRIQTVYLLLVCGLFIALFFLPLAFVQTAEATYSLNVCTVKSLTEPSKIVMWTWQLSLSATIVALLSVAAIFLYKKRKLQKWTCIVNLLLILVFCFYTGYYMFNMPEPDQKSVINPSIWVVLPVIACILNILAMNRISADEKLIRSLDRIR
jgi:uncharacterized membrane protein